MSWLWWAKLTHFWMKTNTPILSSIACALIEHHVSLGQGVGEQLDTVVLFCGVFWIQWPQHRYLLWLFLGDLVPNLNLLSPIAYRASFPCQTADEWQCFISSGHFNAFAIMTKSYIRNMFLPKTGPGQTKPSKVKPNQATLSQAKPSQAKPSQTKPSQARPSQSKVKAGFSQIVCWDIFGTSGFKEWPCLLWKSKDSV